MDRLYNNFVKDRFIKIGQELYHKIREELFADDTSISLNLIGICTDNASNMISSKDAGVVNRLIQEIPHLIHVRDLCHCYNLIVNDALETFPAYIIQFIKDSCSYLNRGQRYQAFREYQISKNKEKPLELLTYREKRWPSLLQCAERLLLIWDDLENYFDTTDSSLKQDYKDYEHKLYVYLLTILLHRLVGYIVAFEKYDLLFDQVMKKIKQGFVVFGRLLLKPSLQKLELSSFSRLCKKIQGYRGS